MSDLTALTLAQARDGLLKKSFSAAELADAHLAAMEKARALNAYVLETPERAHAMARAADARIHAGRAGPLEGIPLAVKDMFCTEGVRTTACARILENFIPPYESTVTTNLWRDGAVLLGKTNNDEFAMGSSNETSHFGPVVSPWRGEGETKLVPGGSSGGSAAAVAAHLCLGATGTDTGGSIRQPAAFTGTVGIKPTYGRCSRWGIVAFASSLDQAGPFAKTVRDAAILLRSMSGHDPKDTTSVDREVPDYEQAIGKSVKGMKIGIPKEYRIDGMPSEIDALWKQGADWLKAAGAELVDVSLPHTKYALPAYYIVAPAEASSNLARYDGVRYGVRENGRDIVEMYENTRAKGFGAEVRRRVMIGTYVLSAGYYDAYYLRAQKVRTLIKRDFETCFNAGVHAILTPATPSAAFGIGEKSGADPIEMYLNDVFTVTVNMAGLPGIAVPAGLDAKGLPLGLQLIGRPFDEETLFSLGAAIESSAGHYAPQKMVAGSAMSQAKPVNKLIKGATGDWEIVVGMEVHAQVVSQAKLFSGAATEFGGEPNSHVSLVDAAMPGMLPVINEMCVRQAVRTGLGLDAKINARSVFDRKNYFYPDLPQGYQISQYKSPIVGEGSVTVETPNGPVVVGIERLHLEQDAGKSLHDQHATMSFVDLNRAGVALMEIVSKPDLRSAEDAKAYVSKLRTILRYLDTCDGDMEKGSLRADVNVSVRRPGEPLGTRCEIKNVNSVRFIGEAIEIEARRQIEILEDGGKIDQETRLFDPDKRETRSMRSKEEAHDYRYFPDPDLLPVELTADYIAELKSQLPELPDRKIARLVGDYGLSAYDAGLLSAERATADYFEAVVTRRDAKIDPKIAANWVVNELFGRLNKEGKDIASSPVSSDQLGVILSMIGDGTISGKIAKDVFEIVWTEGGDPRAVVEQRGLKQVTDTGAIEKLVDEIVAANPDKVAQAIEKPAMLGWFVGQVMKNSGGKANPQAVSDLLKRKLGL